MVQGSPLQVVLSLVLPVPLIALLILSQCADVMSAFALPRSMALLGGLAGALVLAFNAPLLLAQSFGLLGPFLGR